MQKLLLFVIAVLAASLIGVVWLLVVNRANAERHTNELRADLAKVNQDMQAAQVNIDAEATQRVEDLLTNNNPKVRQKALELLAVWKPERISVLLPKLLEKESDPGATLVELDVAARLKCTAATDQVLPLLVWKDKAVQRKAAATFGELASGMKPETQDQACNSIVPAVERELKAMASAPQADPGLIMPYIETLGKLKRPAAKAEILNVLRLGRQPILRRTCVLVIRDWLVKEDEDALKTAWRNEPDSMVQDVLYQVLTKEPFNLKVDHQTNNLVPQTASSR